MWKLWSLTFWTRSQNSVYYLGKKLKFAATIWISYNFEIQKRRASAETIWVNTVFLPYFDRHIVYSSIAVNHLEYLLWKHVSEHDFSNDLFWQKILDKRYIEKLWKPWYVLETYAKRWPQIQQNSHHIRNNSDCIVLTSHCCLTIRLCWQHSKNLLHWFLQLLKKVKENNFNLILSPYEIFNFKDIFFS